MFRLPAIFFAVLLLSGSLFAQRTISGTVIDVANGQPLAGASVFINNTSKGGVTDKNGYFELGGLPEGQQELIVSPVGYETNVFSFSSDSLPLRVKVEMQVKVKELENVLVERSVLEGWDKWGRLFTEHFIGVTPNASQCRIKNYKSIHFRFYPQSNRIIAWSDEPLVVENRALGYTLIYQLEDFEVNFKTNVTTFTGYPYFEDHAKEGKRLKSRWQSNRIKAYHGSMMEFMRNLYANTLNEAGYELRRMQRRPNLEKQRVRDIYRGRASLTIRTGNARNPQPARAGEPVDSSDYYERVLSQEDNIDTYSRHVLTADSLVIRAEASGKLVWFSDYLYITYRREKEELKYLEFHGERRSPVFQRSHIWLTNGNAILVDANGNYSPPQEVFAMSYWGWSEKISDLLPIDYSPRE